MEFSFDLFSFLLCFVTGIAAGFIDATVGGGGLVSMPVLLALNIPPHNIIATNKLHSLIGTGFALQRFARQGLVDFKRFFPTAFLIIIVSAVIGSLTIKSIPATYIYKMIPLIMMGILFYKMIYFNHGIEETNKHLIKPILFIIIFAPLLGFYDGFFGPGTGTFWIFALVIFLGQNMLNASANTKLLNSASNLGSLLIFIPSGLIIYKIAFTMAAGQIFGAWFGVHLSVKKGAKFINAAFIIVMLALIIRLFYKYYIS